MKLKKLQLNKASILKDEDLKQIFGGDAVSVLCYVGKDCRVYDSTYGTTTSGTCQGATIGNITQCFCSAQEDYQIIINTSGFSHCTKGI